MLSPVERRARIMAEQKVQGDIIRFAAMLREEFPELIVTTEPGGIVLAGRVALDDARLRWIAGMLR